MKKLLFLFIFLVCVFLCFSCSSVPKDTGDFECTFNQEEKTASIDKYNGKDTEIVIPDAFGKYKVTKIGYQAFNELFEITSVTLPKHLEIIDFQAFRLCVSLEEIIFPDTLTTIETAAFADCRNLKEVTIPKNISKLGIGVFSYCNSLEKIIVDKENKIYSSDEYGVLYMNNKILMHYPAASENTEYTIPEGVTEIDAAAFANTENLEDVTFPSSLELVSVNAFEKSNITKAVFGNKLKKISENAFSESMLCEISLTNNVEEIGAKAFAYCPLTSINIPASVKRIGSYAFEGCSAIEKFVVDKNNLFYTSDEHGVLFTKDMEALINYPLANTNEEYTIPNGVARIAENAFRYNINLKKITIPDSVETIESYAFGSCIYLKDIVYEGTKPSNIVENAFEK